MSRIGDIATDFTVYDGRRHVLGASVLAAMDAGLREFFGEGPQTPFLVKRAKFTIKTGCNGRILLSEGSVPSLDDPQTAVTVTGRLGARAVSACFVPDPAMPVHREAPSANDITEIVSENGYGGNCRIRSGGLESALRCLVDANKHVQLAGSGIRDFAGDRRPTTELAYIEALTLDAAIHRLDSSLRIQNAGARLDSTRLYTLNQLRFNVSDGSERSMRMAFSFVLPEGA